LDTRGQVNVAGAAVAAIIGVLGILIFGSVYAALNTDDISTGAVSLLSLVDLLLAAVLVIGVVGVLAIFGMQR
jgi:hypothetical protein